LSKCRMFFFVVAPVWPFMLYRMTMLFVYIYIADYLHSIHLKSISL
jgi:hypothetical protein